MILTDENVSYFHPPLFPSPPHTTTPHHTHTPQGAETRGPTPTDARLATDGASPQEVEYDPDVAERAALEAQTKMKTLQQQQQRQKFVSDTKKYAANAKNKNVNVEGNCGDNDNNNNNNNADLTGLLPTNPVARRAYGKMLKHRREGEERARRDRETQLASARSYGTDDDDNGYDDGYKGGGGGGGGARSVAAEAAAAKRATARREHIAHASREIRDAGGAPHLTAAGVDVDAAGRKSRRPLTSQHSTTRP